MHPDAGGPTHHFVFLKESYEQALRAARLPRSFRHSVYDLGAQRPGTASGGAGQPVPSSAAPQDTQVPSGRPKPPKAATRRAPAPPAPEHAWRQLPGRVARWAGATIWHTTSAAGGRLRQRPQTTVALALWALSVVWAGLLIWAPHTLDAAGLAAALQIRPVHSSRAISLYRQRPAPLSTTGAAVEAILAGIAIWRLSREAPGGRWGALRWPTIVILCLASPAATAISGSDVWAGLVPWVLACYGLMRPRSRKSALPGV